ncbi:MAG: single-stranded DNA-binding protein [Nitrosopumilus sp.]|nr:single-stranded DNA-binding protein [Nitrosopumilus sp.]
MAGYVNKVILIGNLGRDPEVRHAQDGSKIVTLSVATSETWKDRATGERRDRTEWHRVVIFNDRLCEIAEKYIKKGNKIFLEGQLQTRKWTDQSNQERYTTEVILPKFRGELTMLERNDAVGEQSSSYELSEPAYTSPSPASTGTYTSQADLNDEIPF